MARWLGVVGLVLLLGLVSPGMAAAQWCGDGSTIWVCGTAHQTYVGTGERVCGISCNYYGGYTSYTFGDGSTASSYRTGNYTYYNWGDGTTTTCNRLGNYVYCN